MCSGEKDVYSPDPNRDRAPCLPGYAQQLSDGIRSVAPLVRTSFLDAPAGEFPYPVPYVRGQDGLELFGPTAYLNARATRSACIDLRPSSRSDIQQTSATWKHDDAFASLGTGCLAQDTF